MANNVCVVIALRHLSLTMFYILVFTSPLTIALLSAVFLGERITAKKTVALVAGFCGVVIAVAPWSHDPARVGSDWAGQLPGVRQLLFSEHGVVARADAD